MAFPGPFCKVLDIRTEHLVPGNHSQLVRKQLTNGALIEIKSFCDKEKFSRNDFVHVLVQLEHELKLVDPSTVAMKVKRIHEQKKKILKKKKVAGFNNMNEFLVSSANLISKRQEKQTETKCLPLLQEYQKETECIPTPIPKQDTNVPVPHEYQKETECIPTPIPKQDTNAPVPHEYQKETECIPTPSPKQETDLQCPEKSVKFAACQTENDFNDDDIKQLNVLRYKLSVKKKQNVCISRKIAAKHILLKNVETTIGHYSIRNVNKRDDTARKNLHLLRDCQRKVKKLEKSNKTDMYRMELKTCKEKLCELQKQNCDLREHSAILADQLKLEKDKKVSLQKSNSYMKRELISHKKSNNYVDHEDCNSEILNLKIKLENKQNEIDWMCEQTDTLRNECNLLKINTKNPDGSFADNVRLCVIELSGLEVAVEKVSLVIECISRHMFKNAISKDSLPCPSTVQRLVDEGHYIAKTFIAEKVDSADNWGVCRDGTTRNKQKIVDTTVALDTGDVMSLGFSRVAKENAVTIHDVTKSQLGELGRLCRNTTEDEYISKSLEKLSFCMSDRASNEKLANKLLDQWKSEVLSHNSGNNSVIHHLHCMAHVLLGFHNYLTPELKALETSLVNQSGPIGRDALPAFKSWGKRETFVNRVLRTTSDVFGPGGDHYGVRDRWDAHCLNSGLKSLIGNYRDNRFNAIFQTSADVFVHKEDFIKVLDSVLKPNAKLQSVNEDLQSPQVCALLQCLGLYYLKVTGPYWHLIISGQVDYMELYKHVNNLHSYLMVLSNSPETILDKEIHWQDSHTLEMCEIPNYERLSECLLQTVEQTYDLLLKSISVVAEAMMKTINKQLVDFLPGGKFYRVSAEQELERVKFAPVTNLTCEHHFGDLDSSQRRRPRASLHHHSSIQLLKRNRNPLMHWIRTMDPSKKTQLMKGARKGGHELRNSHINSEKSVLNTIHENMTTEHTNKRKRQLKSKDDTNKQNKRIRKTVISSIEPNHIELIINVGECLAVAYQDNWYPGYVEKVIDDMLQVKFMTHCRKAGHFQWPLREDKQLVSKKFVLSNNIVPDCVSSGRQWFIKNFSDLDNQYFNFSKINFV